MTKTLSKIEDIIEDVRKGRMVIIVDDEDRENEGDLIFASEFVSADYINFMAKNGRGLICLTLTKKRCVDLGLTLMTDNNSSSMGTNFTTSIEAASGVTTGISASDRCETIKAATQVSANPKNIVQPGHIFPLMAKDGGVLVRAGHTEAGCDLARLAGLRPYSVICEILKDDGEMARLPDLKKFAELHNIKIGSIADLINYRNKNETLIKEEFSQKVQTLYGEFKMIIFSDHVSKQKHLALVKGQINAKEETLVRVHEPTSLLDFLSIKNLSHSWSITKSLKKISENKNPGVIVMLNANNSLNDLIIDNVKSEKSDKKILPLRSYGIGAQILKYLNVKKMILLANPRPAPSLIGFGLEINGYLHEKDYD